MCDIPFNEGLNHTMETMNVWMQHASDSLSFILQWWDLMPLHSYNHLLLLHSCCCCFFFFFYLLQEHPSIRQKYGFQSCPHTQKKREFYVYLLIKWTIWIVDHNMLTNPTPKQVSELMYMTEVDVCVCACVCLYMGVRTYVYAYVHTYAWDRCMCVYASAKMCGCFW